VNPPTLSLTSPLAEGIERFLAHRRALGRRYDNEAWSLRLLDRYLVAQGITILAAITPPVIEAFLASRPRPHPRSYNLLLGMVRNLFQWLVSRGLILRSPVLARPRRVTGSRVPFLFSVDQAHRLLLLASALPDSRGTYLRGQTHRMVFALLYGLGLRLGEVRRLLVGDVEHDRDLLVIRETKFGKSRLVPYGPVMGRELRRYLAMSHEKRHGISDVSPLLSLSGNVPPSPSTIRGTFWRLLHELDLPPAISRPRVHDLRHSFAVGTLLRWYQEGLDPAQRLLHLSTFLGHVQPESTAVYLTITDALLSEASSRFERYARGGEEWMA
jgi:site-specific recombinase XerD